ncbi:MAG: NAD-dependent epimerase/dehydratase family protein [bacterium]|nr:NAD-dependent epimerase/dehydratase family protein [bacterium]
MLALITGANGFIGSHLVERLLRKNYSVRCLVRKTSDLKWIQHLPVSLLYGDITDFHSLLSAVQKVDYVYHLSGKVRALNEDEFFRVNQRGTKNLLESCRLHAPDLKRFVYISSQAAVGPSPDGTALREIDPPCPVSIYGKSKLQGELETLSYRKHFPVTIIRPPSVYGPRDDDILAIFKNIKMGIKPLIGKKARALSLIHIDDLVDGIVLAAEHPNGANEIFFMANRKSCFMEEWENMVATALEKKAVFVRIPEWGLDFTAWIAEIVARLSRKPALLNRDKVLEMKQPHWVVDSSKAERLLGFTPKIEIKNGIRELYRWYRDQGWL